MMFAHVGGLPLEETLATGGPALLTALGALTAQLRARRIRSRSRSRARRPDRGGADVAPRTDRAHEQSTAGPV